MPRAADSDAAKTVATAADMSRTSDASAAAPEPAGIGPKLRSVRLLRRMTLRQLAVQVGCSAGLLSKVEQGKSVPSLRMLHRIVSALETSIGDLFSTQSGDVVTVYRAGERQCINLNDSNSQGSITLERLAPYSQGQILDGNIHTASPGASNGGAINHVGQELGYVLQGHVELIVAGRKNILGPGDSFFFRSEFPHSYRNISHDVLKIVWVNTPPTF